MNKGIILKNLYPQKNKLIILDSKLGKIECITTDKLDLSVGLLVHYFLENKKNYYFIKTLDLIDVPYGIVKSDILFFHHVLELCYYFIPYGSCFDESALKIFNFLKKFFCKKNIFYNLFSKKLFLYKLFCLIGITPEENFYKLKKNNIDNILEKDLDLYLLGCVKIHPSWNSFKTINFLIKNGMV